MKSTSAKVFAALVLLACNERTRETPAGISTGAAPALSASSALGATSTPPAFTGTTVVAHGDEVALLRTFDPPLASTALVEHQLSLRNGYFADATERGTTEMRPSHAVALTSLALVATQPVEVTVKQPLTVTAARRYGAAAWPGVKDADVKPTDVSLAPGDSVVLVLERPDGGCVYRLRDGLATLPCLDPHVADAPGKPSVRWVGGTPLGVSGSFAWDAAQWADSPLELFMR